MDSIIDDNGAKFQIVKEEEICKGIKVEACTHFLESKNNYHGAHILGGTNLINRDNLSSLS